MPTTSKPKSSPQKVRKTQGRKASPRGDQKGGRRSAAYGKTRSAAKKKPRLDEGSTELQANQSRRLPLAGRVIYPFAGWLLSPMIAAFAMTLSSASVIFNAYRFPRSIPSP